ncbi:MAG: XdhC/CoxI family protein [Pseudomonadota bacterium]|nr:XdhC/CoxI family protein [Pseudomonadota bacterium]MEC8129588.1 XdhC/CoxI family protein [Pseudomonadota bacterium]
MTDTAPLTSTNAALIIRAKAWKDAGHGVALAFVMETWGSSPRPVGSVMVIRDDMAVEGSVSGGCVEGAVIDAAIESLTTGAGQRLDFGVADAKAWEVGLSCGGRIAVLVTPIAEGGLPEEALGDLAGDIVARRAGAVTFDAANGARLERSSEDGEMVSALSDDESSFTFRQVPPRRVVIIGGVHITQFLAPMARQAGYDVVVIDPRAVFSAAERFPGSDCRTAWPDEAMAELGLDTRTAVVTLTHDPKIDDPGLQAALASDAFYIGCLGSRRTHAARCERLAEAGFSKADLARLHGPVGLDIGARTPAEIAVSILAQMIAVESGASGATGL